MYSSIWGYTLCYVPESEMCAHVSLCLQAMWDVQRCGPQVWRVSHEDWGGGEHIALLRARVHGFRCLPERGMRLWSVVSHQRRKPGWEAGEESP